MTQAQVGDAEAGDLHERGRDLGGGALLSGQLIAGLFAGEVELVEQWLGHVVGQQRRGQAIEQGPGGVVALHVPALVGEHDVQSGGVETLGEAAAEQDDWAEHPRGQGHGARIVEQTNSVAELAGLGEPD